MGGDASRQPGDRQAEQQDPRDHRPADRARSPRPEMERAHRHQQGDEDRGDLERRAARAAAGRDHHHEANQCRGEDRRRRHDPVLLVEEQAGPALHQVLPAHRPLRAVDHGREGRAPDPLEERHPAGHADHHRHDQRNRWARAGPAAPVEDRAMAGRPPRSRSRPDRRPIRAARSGRGRPPRARPSSARTCCSATAGRRARRRIAPRGQGARRGRRAASRARRPAIAHAAAGTSGYTVMLLKTNGALTAAPIQASVAARGDPVRRRANSHRPVADAAAHSTRKATTAW